MAAAHLNLLNLGRLLTDSLEWVASALYFRGPFRNKKIKAPGKTISLILCIVPKQCFSHYISFFQLAGVSFSLLASIGKSWRHYVGQNSSKYSDHNFAKINKEACRAMAETSHYIPLQLPRYSVLIFEK